MTQDERWLTRYNEVKTFIKTNHRNPSKYNANEGGLYVNWLRHNRKLYDSELLKEDRMEMFKKLLELSEKWKRVNQYK